MVRRAMLILTAVFPAVAWAVSEPVLMAEAQALQAQGIGYGGSFTPPGEGSPWRMDCSNAARYLLRQTRGVELPRDFLQWIDGDPAPGLQPAAPEEAEKTPQPGRVVARFERSAEDMEALAQQWRQIAGKKLSQGQRQRLRQAVDRLKVQLSELDSALGGAPGSDKG